MSDWQNDIDGWIVLVGVLSACSCALLGNFLVLRRMSLMGDAISHAVLPGLAIAFIISNSRASFPMFLGAVVVGVLTALLTEVIRRHGKVEHGAAMGVVFSLFFALGLILIRRAVDHVDIDPGCVLYGNIAQVPLDALDGIPQAVLNLAGVFLANVLFVGLFYKELRICAFDPALATTLGINASVMHYALMIMVAITTVANFESVGSVLVIAMLIVPAAAAYLLTDRLGMMIAISLVIAAASGVVGHIFAAFGPGWLGFDLSANTSAMMAVVAGLLLFAALMLSPQYGLISTAYHRCKLSLQIVREDILGLLYRWQELKPEGLAGMPRRDLLDALGHGLLTRWALRSLRRRRDVQFARHQGAEPAMVLSQAGMEKASRLVRSHRLWETYLAKYFHLPPDHLHLPAERMEHYITPAMHDDLHEQLEHPTEDPHGKAIPRE
ncbi:MAG: metal ABC transporter permease [Planctomycetes bacterium]|nr:metal ABC transporter permease [Planctomycetota bacterium]MCH8963440.1 metal ABC transporter permease [Planctomycetota bacterium]MCH8968914.1 metal ABC transporter permease [Planctomycetota bacterium]